MNKQVLLNQYEQAIKEAVMYHQLGDEVRERMEGEIWAVHKFLIKCGVEKAELAAIEDKRDY